MQVVHPITESLMTWLGITEAIRNTSKAVMETLINLPPLNVIQRKWALETIIRLRRCELWIRGMFGHPHCVMEEASLEQHLLSEAVDYDNQIKRTASPPATR